MSDHRKALQRQVDELAAFTGGGSSPLSTETKSQALIAQVILNLDETSSRLATVNIVLTVAILAATVAQLVMAFMKH